VEPNQEWKTSISREFNTGETVTIEARVKPGVSGVSFTGWTGAPTNISGNPITLKMDRSYSITAEFKDTQKPVIGELSVTPSSVPLNGDVTIRATATDNIGVKEVIATVVKPDKSSEKLTLTREDSGAYSGAYNKTNIPGKYTVIVQAKDAQGNLSDAKTVQFNVSGEEVKPPAPMCIVDKSIFIEQEQIKFTVSWSSKVISELTKFAGKTLQIVTQILKPNTPPIICDSKTITIPNNIQANSPSPKITFDPPTVNSTPVVLDPGKYKVQVKVKDEKNNESEFSKGVEFIVQGTIKIDQNSKFISIQRKGLSWVDIYTHQTEFTKVGNATTYDGGNGCGPTTAVMALAILGKLPPKEIPGLTSKFGWYVANAYSYNKNGKKFEFTAKQPDASWKKYKKNERPEWPGAHGAIIGWSAKDEDYVAIVGKLIKFLENHGVSVTYHQGQEYGEPGKTFESLSETIKKAIDEEKPVIGTVNIKNTGGGSVGHYMLIIGYHTDANGKIDKFYSLDPYLKYYDVMDDGYINPKKHIGPPENYREQPYLELPLTVKTKRLLILTSDRKEGEKEGEVEELDNSKKIRQLYNFSELEPNNSPNAANTIESEMTGIINPAGDVDYFKFVGQEGEKVNIWIDTIDHQFDAILTLYDSDGETILAVGDDDEERMSLDPAIYHFTLPHSGTFYIKVESYDGSGSENHFYTLYLRREVANDDFGDDFETATPIGRNQTIEGTIGHRGDVDVFRFNAYQDELLTVDVRAKRNGSPLDAVLTLYREKVNENGETVREIVGGWDDVNGYDPTVRRWKIPATGIYYLELKDFNGEGGADYRYTLNFKIEPPPMATIDTTPVTADVQMGEQKAQERKVGNIGGGSVGFASIGQQSGKSRRDLPNPFKGQRQIIFLSPRQASVEAEKATSPTRLRSPASVSQTMDKSAVSPTPKEVPTHIVGQPITMPLPLGPKAGTRSAPSRQASQPPDANAWQWIIVDPTITTVENACNIHKVWMQRKDNMLYFKVETAGRTFDPTTVSLRFNLDTDMRAETGVRLFADMGVDYLVSIGEGTDGVWRWDSATESFNFVSDLTWQKIEGNLVEIGFPLSAINDAEEFALLVELSDDDMLEQDSAPDEGFALITKLPPWLKVEPLAGTADSGEEVPMTITLNAEAVDQTGEISGTVQVISTDPHKERQQIPVKITVTPPQLPFERGPGLFMVSLPISVDRQWHEILGIPEDQMKLAIYSPQQNRYLLYNELAPEQREPKPGVGVWIKLNNAVQTTVTGVPPKASEPFVINLYPGWQIIGVPWQVKWANLKVRKGNEELPISQAAERGWVYEILWTWDDEVGDYQMVWAGVSGIGLEEVLRPFMGYWILALEECQLVIPPKSEASRGVTVSRKRLAENGFVFGLMADDGRSKRRVWLGFSNEALGRGRNRQGVQAAMPPEAPEPSGIQVFALGANGKPLAADIRAGTPKKAEWDIVVRWNQNQGSRGLWSEGRQGGVEEVRLTWEGLGYLPKGMSATLVDMATNTRRYLRTQTIYTFKPASEEKERRFKVILEQGGTGLLRIVNLQANPVRGQGVMIQFALTKSATTQVEVLTLTGRRIAILEAGRSRQAGSHTILWRGTDGEGRGLPLGAYLLRVQAEDEEGRKVQATRTMILR
jgi:hypothetical protein